MYKVLLIENDLDLVAEIVAEFRRRQIQLYHRTDCISGLDLAREQSFDVVIASDDLPGISGLELCRKLRADNNDTAVIIVSEHCNTDSLLRAYSEGVDAYVPKPFTIIELVIRTQALIWRPPHKRYESLIFPQVKLDQHNLAIIHTTDAVVLSRREFCLLQQMLKYPTRTFKRAELVRSLNEWGHSIDEHCIDVHISNIRRRLERISLSRLILTVHGIGYRINQELL